MSCRDYIERLEKELGMKNLSEDSLCKLGYLALKALKPVVERLGLDPLAVEVLEVDPAGPRVIVRAEAPGLDAYLDLSPDGAEVTVTFKGVEGGEAAEVEERVADAIESDPDFEAVEEYDVSYNESKKELVITLYAKLLEELPDVKALRRVVEKSLLTV